MRITILFIISDWSFSLSNFYFALSPHWVHFRLGFFQLLLCSLSICLFLTNPYSLSLSALIWIGFLLEKIRLLRSQSTGMDFRKRGRSEAAVNGAIKKTKQGFIFIPPPNFYSLHCMLFTHPIHLITYVSLCFVFRFAWNNVCHCGSGNLFAMRC